MKWRSLSGMITLHGGEAELYYQYTVPPEAGDTTLVFLHAHSVDLRMWEPQAAAFCPDYPLLRYDLRGYGQSSLPQEGEDYLHARDLRWLLEQLNIGKVHLVGLSLGAFVALDYWALYPEKVCSVTVASAGIPDPRMEGEAPFTGDVNTFKREWYEGLLAHCGPDHNGYRRRLWSMVSDWKAWQPTHREPESLLREKLLPALQESMPMPVCAIWGEQDSEGAKASLRLLLAHVPQAIAVELADAGHFCSMEVPESFNSELRGFWRAMSVPGPSSGP